MSQVASPAALRALIEDSLRDVARDLDHASYCALLLAALADLRAECARTGGYRAMRQFDDWLFEALTRRRLRWMALGRPASVPLPGAGRGGPLFERARVIMRNLLAGVGACARAAGAPAMLLVVADALVDALIVAVDGIPDFAAIREALERPLDEDLEAAPHAGSEMRLQ